MPRLSKIGAAALAAFGWTSGSAVSASYLVVAGGGGAGGITNDASGGGGAGGLLTGTASLNPTLTYTITVGAGGVGGTGAVSGSSGSNSLLGSLISTTGGGGGAYGNGSTPVVGGNGGSGGGGSGAGSSAGGTGVSGQGYAGGSSYGGGGGAGGVGSPSGAFNGANHAGIGVSSSISGASVNYAGGGNPGGSQGNTSYGGGNGDYGLNAANSTAGTANTGGGGGGRWSNAGSFTGSQGGSGIVIISYVGAQQFSGGVVTSSGGNTIHTFTTSGTLGPVTPLSANYLIVGGGASGGGFGGGGAGGLLSGSSLTIDPYSTYVVTVGAGGSGVLNPNAGVDGSNSSFSMVATTAVGGGGGGAFSATLQNGRSGGSGGGAGTSSSAPYTTGSVGAGTSGQGNNGGLGVTGATAGGGGGGATAVGGAGASVTGGSGGTGTSSSISGTSVLYAEGGGGGGTIGGTTAGTGGAGGTNNSNPGGFAGSANKGGGGGGSYANTTYASGNGGSGVVIISYAGSTQLMAGGVVTIAGGNVIHTFNSSGYLTPLTLLTRSLRFRSSASAYLNRTQSSGSSQKFTLSQWVKRGKLGATQYLFTAFNASTDGICFSSSDQLEVFFANGSSYDLITTAVYRDPAAWYHIVVLVDTTQATAANRVQLYVNGVAVSFGSGTQPPQNYNFVNFNANAVVARIGTQSTGVNYLDGYLAEVNFIDGQALAPTAFGTVNSYGVWQPITYGGSYGTNGFRLPFTNNASTAAIGYDFSPQGNNWTTNNISVTAGSTYDSMTDVPTLTSATAANYPIVNLLAGCTNNTSTTYSNGNLQVDYNITSGRTWAPASIALPATGSFYFEFVQTAASQNPPYSMVGLLTTTLDRSNYDAPNNGGRLYNLQSGNKFSNGTQTAYGATVALNDVVGIAVDMSAGTLTFYKNNTSQGVAFTDITSSGLPWIFGFFGNAGSSGTVVFNFGQRPFAYTPPTGYLALNTFNV